MGSSHTILGSHEFLGRTDDRHPVTQLLTHQCYSPRDLGVCQVLAIPGQQIVNCVNSRHRNMGGVTNGTREEECPQPK